jgi:hypothetical protein
VAVNNIFFIDDRVQDKEALFSAIGASAKKCLTALLGHGLNQNSFHKLEHLLSSWHKQFLSKIFVLELGARHFFLTQSNT